MGIALAPNFGCRIHSYSCFNFKRGSDVCSDPSCWALYAQLSTTFITAVTAQGAGFEPGHIVALRLLRSASNSTRAIQLDEYDVTGLQSSPLSAIAIPSSGVNKLTNTAASPYRGTLKLSSDSNYLTFGGYDAAAGTTTLSSSVGWVVGRVTVGDGTVDLSTKITKIVGDSASRGGPQTAITSNGNDIWVAGDFGVGYTTLGSSTLTKINQAPERHTVGIFGGQLYVSGSASAVAPPYVMGAVGNGLPKTPNSMDVSLPGLPTTNGQSFPYDFWFRDANTFYLAEPFPYPHTGIQKWTFNGSVWQYQYNLLSSSIGYLSGSIDPSGNTVLFATSGFTSDNLLSIVDGGSQALSTSSVLATAPSGTSFAGVAFIASVPEPGSLFLMGLGGLVLLPLIRLRRLQIAIKS